MPRPAILLVDDEPTILTSLKSQLLGLFGRSFTYETAPCVADAWDILQELADEDVTVVVIVSDWLMPDVRGDTFLTEVRERFPSIVRILLTGQADPAAIERAHQQARVARVIHKPWSAEELRQTIVTALDLPDA